MSVGRLLFVVNEVGFFLSHRLQLACAARNAGYEVHVAAPDATGTELVRANKFCFHAIPINRKGINPVLEIIRNSEAAFMGIHHNRKQGGGAGMAVRGSTALTGGVDIVMELNRLSPHDR